ncbi:hypothetical protein HHI36_022306 [Cryptolaemus montrouzieri]|uniref:Uncharacterized protein n=1 Tax=Cryptolaemus montrouzieri TaxID=559131 RepID=A0ABD2MZG2_9CUCU
MEYLFHFSSCISVLFKLTIIRVEAITYILRIKISLLEELSEESRCKNRVLQQNNDLLIEKIAFIQKTVVNKDKGYKGAKVKERDSILNKYVSNASYARNNAPTVIEKQRRNTLNYLQKTDPSSFPHGNVRTTQEDSAQSSTESSLSGCQNTSVNSWSEITSSAAEEAIDNALNYIRIISKTDEYEWQTITKKNNFQEK